MGRRTQNRLLRCEGCDAQTHGWRAGWVECGTSVKYSTAEPLKVAIAAWCPQCAALRLRDAKSRAEAMPLVRAREQAQAADAVATTVAKG